VSAFSDNGKETPIGFQVSLSREELGTTLAGESQPRMTGVKETHEKRDAGFDS
jgi:hypothetical protein